MLIFGPYLASYLVFFFSLYVLINPCYLDFSSRSNLIDSLPILIHISIRWSHQEKGLKAHVNHLLIVYFRILPDAASCKSVQMSSFSFQTGTLRLSDVIQTFICLIVDTYFAVPSYRFWYLNDNNVDC